MIPTAPTIVTSRLDAASTLSLQPSFGWLKAFSLLSDPTSSLETYIKVAQKYFDGCNSGDVLVTCPDSSDHS